MLVHFVTDQPTKIPAVRAILEPPHRIHSLVLGHDDSPVSLNGILVIDADLRQRVRIEQLRLILQKLSSVPEKLFVVRNDVGAMVAQAYALGATAVLSGANEIISRLAPVEAAEKVASRSITTEIADSIAAFDSMFAAIRNGKPISLSVAERVTSQIINSITQNGLTNWLDDVRRHHQGTFQHCLLVTGLAVGFATEIGFTNADVQRLGTAATLHDIGKARVPLSILDKPGSLDPLEEAIMRRHPVIGYESLKPISNIGPEIIDGVRHHHEYLDGSGYPDGLIGSEISDLVRLLTISDIFAALIESRPYRPAMPNSAAYNILCDMPRKLELSLVKAFRKVALAA